MFIGVSWAGSAALVAAALAAGEGFRLIALAIIFGCTSFLVRSWLPKGMLSRLSQRKVWLSLHGLESAVIVSMMWAWPFSGMLVMAAGSFCNSLVVAVNGWRMPISRASNDPNICTIDSATRLWWLGDTLQVRGWRISAGDVLITAGMWSFAIELVLAQ